MGNEAGVSARLVALRENVRRGLSGVCAPLVNWLAARGATPGQVSWVGFDLAVVAALFAGFRVFIAAGIIYLIVGIADLVDGALARRGESASAGGAFLDSILDRAGEGLIHAGAAVAFAYWGMWIGVLAVALSLIGSYLTSYARARAEGLGIALDEVWFGRGERLILLALGLIFHFALIAFWILAVLGWASAGHRFYLARRRLAVAGAGKPQEGEESVVQETPAADADSD